MKLENEYPNLKASMLKWFGIKLTTDQLAWLLLTYPENLFDALKYDSSDTYDRDNVISAIVDHVLGSAWWYPLNGDDSAYKIKFNNTFYKQAMLLGYEFDV